MKRLIEDSKPDIDPDVGGDVLRETAVSGATSSAPDGHLLSSMSQAQRARRLQQEKERNNPDTNNFFRIQQHRYVEVTPSSSMIVTIVVLRQSTCNTHMAQAGVNHCVAILQTRHIVDVQNTKREF